MSRRKTVSLMDIADRLGLTVHTVSKALRGKAGMSEETRRLVFRTAWELGYRTKAQEQAMMIEGLTAIAPKPHHFAFVTGANGELMSLLYDGIRERLNELGHQIDIFLSPPSVTQPFAIREWVERSGIGYSAGVFISPLIAPGLERSLHLLPNPKILLNYPQAGMNADSVIWDVYDAMVRCVNVLVGAGHTRILYVGPIEARRGFRRRWQAFREALQDHGIREDPGEWVMTLDGPQEEWLKTLADKRERLRPTAMICAIEYVLPWIYKACGALNISIPDDMSLVSMETLETPSDQELTYSLLPVRDTGIRAVDRMLWRLANPHLPYEHLCLQCRWHQGSTVKSIVTCN
jgi:LacI family transcriptional regulator